LNERRLIDRALERPDRSAEVVVFRDSGHWPHIDDPDRAAEVITPFLKRHARGTAA
jgi:pimeloyl-ACP methyl ester carboxylesterase